MVFYAVPGLGKTSLGASIPGGVIMYNEQEDGITTLKTSGQVDPAFPQLGPITSWDDAFDAIDSLIYGEHSYTCLSIDTMGGFEKLCHRKVTEKEFNNDAGPKGFLNFHKGFDVALPYWRLFLNKLDELRDKKRMRIILLAHARINKASNPEGTDYERWVPQCHDKTWEVTHQWADMVLFGNYIVAVDDAGKARGGNARFLYTQFSPAYAAKNRYGLPPSINMGQSATEAWENIVNAIQNAKGN